MPPSNSFVPAFASGAARTTGEGAEVRISYPYSFIVLGPIADYLTGNGAAYGTVTMQTGFVMRIE